MVRTMHGLGWVALLMGVGCGPEYVPKGDETPPTVGFESPDEGHEVAEGAAVTVVATVTDNSTSSEDLSLEWYQDGESVCGDSAVVDGKASCELTLVADTTIKLVATDLSRNSAEATRSLVVIPNEPPTIVVFEPAVGPEYYVENPVPFEAVVGDDNDPLDELEVVWRSDLDGEV